MSKKKYKKGIDNIKKEIEIHKNIKLEKALEEENIELAAYYEKEIKGLEEQLMEKQKKLLPRNKRLKLKKQKRLDTKIRINWMNIKSSTNQLILTLYLFKSIAFPTTLIELEAIAIAA